MDQDSFRHLLASSSSTTTRTISSSTPALAVNSFKSSKSKGNKPAKDTKDANSGFKPRKVKQLDEKYRDRAAERRLGSGADYDQVESILEEIERRNNNDDTATEAANNENDDDMLEQAFEHAPAKRTRADIIRELKEKRLKGGPDAPTPSSPPLMTKETKIDDLKQAGKFKPIGFQPIGGDKAKKRKTKDGKEGDEKKKKKKRKIVEEEQKPENLSAPLPPVVTTPKEQVQVAEPDPEVNDIFAGVEEYEGLELDDNEDEEDGEVTTRPEEPSILVEKPRWFNEEDPDLMVPAPLPAPEPVSQPEPTPSHPPEEGEEDEDIQEEELPTRLQPLYSSSVPSIKELLAMDDTGSGKRRKGKKGKKKNDDDGESNKPKMSTEAKVDRDYKRLKSYTDKRGDK